MPTYRIGSCRSMKHGPCEYSGFPERPTVTGPLLPSMERLLADPELANDLGHRSARLSLPQCERNLLFRKCFFPIQKTTLFGDAKV